MSAPEQRDSAAELDRLISSFNRAQRKLLEYARLEHKVHSPKPEYPTEYLACLREPCKTIREAIQGSGDDD